MPSLRVLDGSAARVALLGLALYLIAAML